MSLCLWLDPLSRRASGGSLPLHGARFRQNWHAATFEQIGTVGANQTSFASTGLKSNTRYYFRVRAFNELGFSAPSNSVNVRTKAK